jgi:hypothetical protein
MTPHSLIALTARERALVGGVLALLLLAAALPGVAQFADYHAFADQRTLMGIPRALDVLTNLPFALVGVVGLWRLRASQRADFPQRWPQASRRLAALFFVGLIATAWGSAYYHWAPDDAGLVIDRACMTLSFAGLLGLAASERVSGRAGGALAVVALIGGGLSLVVWAHTGNLTPWSVFQGGGILLVLVLLSVKPVGESLHVSWLAVVLIYALAKVAEGLDAPLFELTGALSGHSLKHLVASLAAWPVIRALARRAPAAGAR